VSRRVTAFWILFAATLAVYLIIVGWSLPTISAAAGGMAPFDMRPGGYSFDQAQAYLAALSPDGTAFYLDIQHRLDLIYPALLAATLFFGIWLLTPPTWGIWRWLLALAAIPGSVFDYLENYAVATMLRLGADGITPDIVATADRWTRLKSVFTTIAMTILLVLLVIWAGRRLMARRGIRA
jgi:hypothetical protein